MDQRNLKSLPKAHLHIHLEGAMRRSTLEELCKRYGIAEPMDTRGIKFDKFGGFVKTYWAACDCIRSKEDLRRLIFEVAEDAADDGCLWVEPALDVDRYCTIRKGNTEPAPPQLFTTDEEGWEFVLGVACDAEKATGVGIGFMSAVDRSMSLEVAYRRAKSTNEIVRKGKHMIEMGVDTLLCVECSDVASHPGIVSFGLHGNEEGFPPGPFAQIYKVALEGTCLLCTPHAGEIAPSPGGGAASVNDALDLITADQPIDRDLACRRRILHGVLAIEDKSVVDRLARERVCLDVCPTSNLLLKVFPSVEAHPLRQLMEAGVPCSLGSDDPLLFGPCLLEEYTLCREQMHLSDALLAQLAWDSFEFSGAPPELKEAGKRMVNEWLQGWPSHSKF